MAHNVVFKNVDELFDKLARKNREELENAKITPIHDKFLYAQNGIWCMIGGMGIGKSYNYLKLAAKQEQLFEEPFFETIVISSTSGEFDKTVITFREAIKKSNLLSVKDSDLMNWIEEYTSKVLLYNTLMKFVRKDLKYPNDEMKKIIETNRLNTKPKLIEFIAARLSEIGWKTYPHRLLLILDDFSSHPLLKRKEDPLSRMLKKLRHFNITVMICVQTVKSIPKDIKRNMSDLMLFPGISEEDFKYLIRESSASKFDYRKLWEFYSKIKDKHTLICIHIAADKIMIHPPTN
jgi:hypothetical protein